MTRTEAEIQIDSIRQIPTRSGVIWNLGSNLSRGQSEVDTDSEPMY